MRAAMWGNRVDMVARCYHEVLLVLKSEQIPSQDVSRTRPACVKRCLHFSFLLEPFLLVLAHSHALAQRSPVARAIVRF